MAASTTFCSPGNGNWIAARPVARRHAPPTGAEVRCHAASVCRVVKYLSIGEFASRAQLSVNTMKGYMKKGLLPSPDAKVGKTYGWLEVAAEEWIADRRPRP